MINSLENLHLLLLLLNNGVILAGSAKHLACPGKILKVKIVIAIESKNDIVSINPSVGILSMKVFEVYDALAFASLEVA